MNKMMAITISAGATTFAPYGTALPPNLALTMPPPTATRTRKKRPEQLGEQPPSLVPVVQEVELTGHRVRLSDGPQRNLGVANGLLPFRIGWRGCPARLTGHLNLIPAPRASGDAGRVRRRT